MVILQGTKENTVGIAWRYRLSQRLSGEDWLTYHRAGPNLHPKAAIEIDVFALEDHPPVVGLPP